MANLTITDLTKTFPRRGRGFFPLPGQGLQENSIIVLNKITFRVQHGEFFFLLGPSGCGKSTLLRIIAGLELPTSGSVYLDSIDWTLLPPQARDIGFVFQQYALWPHLSVTENISLGLRARNKDYSLSAIQRVLELVSLQDYAHHYPHELSGGQQQRVAIARAIALEPALILMDEPLSNLDRKLRDGIREELKRLHKRLGTTIVYVTHDQEEALSLGDRIAVLHEGSIIQCDTPQTLYRNPASPFIASFIGDNNVFSISSARQEGNVTYLFVGDDFLIVENYNASIPLSNVTGISFSPRDITISHQQTQRSQPVTVETCLFLGSSYLLTLRMAHNTLLRAYAPADAELSAFTPGTRRWFSVNQQAIHLFYSTPATPLL